MQQKQYGWMEHTKQGKVGEREKEGNVNMLNDWNKEPPKSTLRYPGIGDKFGKLGCFLIFHTPSVLET